MRNKVSSLDVYWDINTDWSPDQIPKIPKGHIEDLISYQLVFTSRYTSENDTLFLILHLLQILSITLLQFFSVMTKKAASINMEKTSSTILQAFDHENQ